MKKYIALFFTFFALDIFVYFNLWQTFFQQDEWYGFGKIIYLTQAFPYIFTPQNLATSIFSAILKTSFYFSFGFNASYYALIALIFHSVICLLAFILFRSLTNQKYTSFILSFLFLVSFPARQAVMWFATLNSLLPSVMLTLFFFVYLLSLRKRGTLFLKNLIILSIIFLSAMSFQEEAIITIPLMILGLFLWFKKTFLKNKWLYIFLIFIALYAISRPLLFGGRGQLDPNYSPKKTLIYNSVTIPPKMIVQNMIEFNDFLIFSRFYNELAYPYDLYNITAIEHVVSEDLIFLLFIPVALLIGYAFGVLPKEKKKVLIFSITWIILSSWVIGLQSRRLYGLESRYLFLPDVGVLLLFYSIYYAFWQKRGTLRKIITIIAVFCVIIFSVYSYSSIRELINSNYIPVSNQRKSVINQVLTIKPKLPRKVVFYAQCQDKNNCQNYIFPFYSGFGHLLLVNYANKDRTSYAPFFQGNFLWDTDAQGYKEINEYGFGYFRDLNRLKVTVRDYSLNPEEIISLSYDSKTNKVTNISAEINKIVFEGK